MKIIAQLLLTILIAVTCSLNNSFAQSAEVSTSADKIMAEIMSPYCPGRLLRDCPSGQALQLKEKIISRLSAGESEQAIVADLVATFGEEVRAAPEARGFGLVAWIAPFLFLFLGSILTVLWLRSRALAEEISQPATPLDADSEERLSRLVD